MDLKSMTLIEMQEYMESIVEKKFRAKQIYEWFHKHLALSLDEMKYRQNFHVYTSSKHFR